MKKALPLILLAIVIAAIAIFFLSKERLRPQTQPQISATQTPAGTQDEALKNALNLYAKKKAEGLDFSNGPCLGQIAPDWVADIAHNPRLPIDDRPENQCADFRNGSAHHFIELDPEGNLIRIF